MENNKVSVQIKRIKKELKVYRVLLKDKETPFISKFLLGFAIGYLVSPIDLIPDFIPIIGHLDDLVIVPFLVFLALKFIPTKLIDKVRNEVKN